MKQEEACLLDRRVLIDRGSDTREIDVSVLATTND